MIIISQKNPKVLLADMSWWSMIKNASREIYHNYKLLCPTIFYAENYNAIQDANKRFKTPHEAIGISPWQLLAKNELEGQEILRDDIFPHFMKIEQDMDNEEKDIIQSSKKMIDTFDKADQRVFQSGNVVSLKTLNALGNLANAPYQSLTLEQLVKRFKEISHGSVFEKVIPIIEQQPDKEKIRAAINKVITKSAEQYPIDTFKKACKMSQSILEDNFIEVCDTLLISEFERTGIEFDNTYWKKNRDNLLSNPKSYSSYFPYTSYTLYLHVAFTTYQKENSHNQKIVSTTSSRDFEYLYYTYFSNVLFVSMDKQHQIYIEESEILKSRLHSSFIYVPHENDDENEYKKRMEYIQYRNL